MRVIPAQAPIIKRDNPPLVLEDIRYCAPSVFRVYDDLVELRDEKVPLAQALDLRRAVSVT